MARMKMVDGHLAEMSAQEEAAFLASLPPAPGGPPVPQEISDRQFAQQLAIDGVITEPEALAWASRGDLPPTLEAAISELPDDKQFSARMLLSSATTYQRSHSLTASLGAVMGFDDPRLDDLWRAAALL